MAKRGEVKDGKSRHLTRCEIEAFGGEKAGAGSSKRKACSDVRETADA